MSTNICSYEGCMVRRYPCSSIAFFAIPTDKRRHQWIVNSGNKDLEKLDGTRTRLFCEKHFYHTDIRSQFHRKILRKSAIPIPYERLSSEVQNHRLTASSHKERGGEDAIGFNSTEMSKEYFTFGDNAVACQFEIVRSESSGDEIPEEMPSFTDQEDVDLIEETLEKSEETLKQTLEEVNFIASVSEEEISIDDEPLEREARVTTTTSNVQECDNIGSTCPVDIVHHSTSTANVNGCKIQPSSDSTYDDDRHFALSLVGYFQRLKHDKKVKAKLKILTYLTALDLGECADL